MKHIRNLVLTISVFIVSALSAKSQPAPVDVMFGNKYGSVTFVYSKNFSESSRLGFFHMNNVEFNYSDKAKNSFIFQDLLFVETIKNLRVTAGLAYSKAGLDPTAGLQYIYAGRKLFVLCAPRINIESDPSYDVFSIIQYKIPLNEKVNLFTKAQLLNLFDANGNLKSYQWLRLGLDMKVIQFGLAFNLDEFGPNPTVKTNYGVFIRKEIF